MLFVSAFFIVFAFLLWLLFLYAVYKTIWYMIKMLALKSFIKDMQKSGAVVEPQRKFSDMIFGKKGEADYIISVDGKKYEISVLSFVSTRGRWNVEKTRNHYYVECRRQNKIFYSQYIIFSRFCKVGRENRRYSMLALAFFGERCYNYFEVL